MTRDLFISLLIAAIVTLGLISCKNVKASSPDTDLKEASSLAGLWKSDRGSMMLITLVQNKEHHFKLFVVRPGQSSGESYLIYLHKETEKPGMIVADVNEDDDFGYECGTIEFKPNTNSLVWLWGYYDEKAGERKDESFVRDDRIADRLLQIMQSTNAAKARQEAASEVWLAVNQQKAAEKVAKNPWIVGVWGRDDYVDFTIRADGYVIEPYGQINYISIRDGESVIEIGESQYFIDWDKKTISYWKETPLKKIK